MATLKILVVPTGKILSKTVNLGIDTVDAIISNLQNAGDIVAPETDKPKGTIWKMTKGGKSNAPLGGCTPDPGFTDGELVYLIQVPA